MSCGVLEFLLTDPNSKLEGKGVHIMLSIAITSLVHREAIEGYIINLKEQMKPWLVLLNS